MKEQKADESRLYRIEKSLELLIQGALEISESQKKTDEQLKKNNEGIKEVSCDGTNLC